MQCLGGGVLYLLVVFPLETAGSGLSTSALFIKQPENTTAREGTTHTFYCAISNSSLRVFWYVNDTDASYVTIRQRGISIHPINQTSSQLAVNASRINNNTYIHCTAFLFDPFIEFPSQKALLVVEAVSKQQTSLVSSLTYPSTPSHSIRSTSRALVPSVWIGTDDSPTAGRQQPRYLKAVLSVLAGILLLALTCVSLLVVFLVRKKYHSKCGLTDHKEDSTPDSIKMVPNPLYECHKPIRCAQNAAYNDVQLPVPDTPLQILSSVPNNCLASV